MPAADFAVFAVESAEDAIICTDRDGRITWWNPAAERLLGYAAGDMAGRDILALFPPEGQREAAAALVRILNRERTTSSDRTFVRKDGRRVTLSVTMSPIRDAAGNVIGASTIAREPPAPAVLHLGAIVAPSDDAIIGEDLDRIVQSWNPAAERLFGYAASESKSARDIGEQKHASGAALHLAAIVESSEDAIISKDLNGIVQSWNPAAERLFGYSSAEMVGRSITTIIPEDRLEEEAYVLGRIREGRSVEHFETVRKAKDGRLVDISLMVSPIRDVARGIIGASKIARDVGEHKRLLLLDVQNRRIQEASRLKSEFVANMSHELRTPLNSIVGFAELMADARFGPLPDKYQTFAQMMHTSAQHLLRLINDILDLAKLESGKVDFRPERVELATVVDEAMAVIGGLAARRKLQLIVDIDPALGAVRLDPMRLKQVLYNYLSNAIKFTPEGGRVTIRVRPDDGERFRIEVEDTGPGISPEDEDRLFIEFQQLDASSAKKVGGSGLGLALTKRLVEAQGGTIGVHSVFGSGSTFFATLPREVSAHTADMTSPAVVRTL